MPISGQTAGRGRQDETLKKDGGGEVDKTRHLRKTAEARSARLSSPVSCRRTVSHEGGRTTRLSANGTDWRRPTGCGRRLWPRSRPQLEPIGVVRLKEATYPDREGGRATRLSATLALGVVRLKTIRNWHSAASDSRRDTVRSVVRTFGGHVGSSDSRRDTQERRRGQGRLAKHAGS
jgi:hypothetical protein